MNTWLIVFCVAIAAYKDHRTGEIPILLFPIMLIGSTILMMLDGSFDFVASILGAVAGGVVFLCAALFFKGGGGDVIMMAALGWCMGIYSLCYIVIASSLAYLLQLTITAVRRRVPLLEIQEPYAPSVLVGVLFAFVLLRYT